MTTPVTSPAAQAFLAAVETELADLPADERAELLEDLEQHLLAVEADGDERSLSTRLGTAADYAAELRAAAGLPAREPSARQRRLPDVRRTLASLADTSAGRELRAFVPLLTPAWWVLRGYLVVLLPGLRNNYHSGNFPVPTPWGSGLIGAVLVIGAVVLSVKIGRHPMRRGPTVIVIVLEVVLAIAAIKVAVDAPQRFTTQVIYQGPSVGFEESPLVTPNGPVTDIFPFASDGTALSDVLLYDQNGQPLQTGPRLYWEDNCQRVLAPPVALDGATVPFSYSQHYVPDRSQTDINGSPIIPDQCKVTPRPTINPPALIKPVTQAATPKPAPRAAVPAATPTPAG